MLAMADETNFFRRVQEEDETVEEYLAAFRTLVDRSNLPADQLVRLLTSQLVVGRSEKTIQQELLATVDPTIGRVVAIMRANGSAQKESDWMNPHDVSRKPERGKPNMWQRQPRKRRRPT